MSASRTLKRIHGQLSSQPRSPVLLLFALFYLGTVHYWQPHPSGIGLAMPSNCLSWCVVTIVILTGVMRMTTSKAILYNDFSLLLLAIVAALLVPYLYGNSEYPSNSYGRMLGLVAGLLVFLTIQQQDLRKQDWTMVLALLTLGALIESLIGWYQYIALHAPPFGILQQRNNQATLLVTGIACSFHLLNAQVPVQFRIQMQILRMIALASVLVSGAVIALLGSQTAWLALVLVLVLLSISPSPNSDHVAEGLRWSRLWLLALFVSVLAGIYLGYTAPPVSVPGLGTSFVDDIASMRSGEVRLGIYKVCLAMMAESPWTGFGYGDFLTAFLNFRADHPEFRNVVTGGLLTHPHNEMLLWGVEGGLLPVAAMLLGGVWFMARGIRARGTTSFADWALLLPLVIHSLLEFPFHQSTAQWINFVVLLAYAERHAPLKRANYRLGYVPAIISSALVPIVFVYMFGTMQASYYLQKYRGGDPHELRPLTNVLLPAGVSERYYHTIMLARLANGLRGGLRDEVEAFLDWAERAIPARPSATYYHAWLDGLVFVGRDERAAQVLADAHRLFPRNHSFDRVHLDSHARD